MDDDNIDEKILLVYELNNINEALKDEEVNDVLIAVTKIIANPNVSAKTAQRLMLSMEASAFSFEMKGKNYMLLDKGAEDASLKKNLYLSLSKATYSLVQALKIVTKAY